MVKRKAAHWAVTQTAVVAIVCAIPQQPTRSVLMGVNGEAVRIETDEQKAVALRAKWMRALGIPEAEIAHMCNLHYYPANLQEEIENLLAMDDMQNNPLTPVQLDRLAEKLGAPPARFMS